MYLRKHRVQNVKLLRDVVVDFVRPDGTPRMWTVFVGENRLCKTTLLQTIAATACGVDRGTQLVTDVIASWPDLRNPIALAIESDFGFSAERHEERRYPGLDPRPAAAPTLRSSLKLAPEKRVFTGQSAYLTGDGSDQDPLTSARIDELPDWFVAGYGPSRLLPSAARAPQAVDPTLDRLRPLFGGALIGTGFIELLGGDLGRAFARVLKSVFVDGMLLPHVTDLELRGRGGIRSAKDLIESQRFEMDLADAKGKKIRVPATWLSQGYQSLIAWLADFVGYILLEGGADVSADEMEGVVLIDELDLHLHPTWQVQLVPLLKRVFPRLQFIATTHSPMVLPGLTQDEVFVLSQDKDGSVVATQASQSPQLLTGSELYGSFFGLNQLYPSDLGDKLQQYINLATDPLRTDEEQGKMEKLRGELEAAGIELDAELVERDSEA